MLRSLRKLLLWYLMQTDTVVKVEFGFLQLTRKGDQLGHWYQL